METRNTVHGNRAITERRLSLVEQMLFYRQQAKLAAQGHTTRRTEGYFLRQVEYFRAELAAQPKD